ncbi:unnamed protein product [Lasius platythorax]|uniref:Uncharacterized protein n=1 Tax=Lasius platythorax TaxID=488582 RepID=A0AAV2NB38_9HYME
MPLRKNSVPATRSLQLFFELHCVVFLAFPLIFRLQRAYGDAWKSASSVRRWVKKHFKDGNTSIQNQPHNGRLRTASTEHNKKRVDAIIKDDRRVTVDKAAAKLRIRDNAVQEMTASFGRLERSFSAKASLNCQNGGKMCRKKWGLRRKIVQSMMIQILFFK